MADFYCDHDNTVLYPSAYMSVPTSAAALPQDGDGKANGTVTPTVASASWDLTSASGSGATMSVMGATISGLTGSGATIASAIAAAINSSTAAVTAANGNIASVYLKALVWATSSGAILTVYSRIASADLNYSTNASCLMAAGTGWTSPPATAQFSGGVSGPWRYFINTSVLTAAVSAAYGTAIGSIGAWSGTPMGNPVGGDIIHLRSKRAGFDIVVQSASGFSATCGRTAGVNRAAPLIYSVDSGVKWDGDSGVFVLRKDASVAANQTYLQPSVGGTKYILQGQRNSVTACSWKLDHYGVNNGSGYALNVGNDVSAPSTVVLDGLEFSDTATGNVNLNLSCGGYAGSVFPMPEPGKLVRNCVFKTPRPKGWDMQGHPSYSKYSRYENCLFDYTGLAGANTNAVSNYYQSSFHMMEYIGCSWILPSGANKTGLNAVAGSFKAVFVDCDFGNLIALGGDIVGTAEGSGQDRKELIVSSEVGARAFVHENQAKLCEWRNSSYPTRNASFPGGGKAVMRMSVTGEAGKVSKSIPQQSVRLGINNENADGTRTLTLDFLVDSNFIAALGRSPKSDELSLLITYVDTNGAVNVIDTRPAIGTVGSTLTSGVAGEWSTTACDISGVPHSFLPFEISATLTDLKQHTTVGIYFCVGIQTNSPSDAFFIDLEPGLQ